MIPLSCCDEQAQLWVLPYVIMNDMVIHTCVPKELYIKPREITHKSPRSCTKCNKSGEGKNT